MSFSPEQLNQLTQTIDERLDAKFDSFFKRLKKEELDPLRRDVTTLFDAVFNTVIPELATLKEDVRTLKTDVSTLKTDVNQLKTDMSRVKRTLIKLNRSNLILLASVRLF